MPENNPNTELDDSRIKAIEEKLAVLSPAFEEIAAERIYLRVIGKIQRVGKILIGVIALVFAFIGYSSYQQVVKISSEKVSKNISEVVLPEIQEHIQDQLNEQSKLELEQLISQISQNASERVDRELAAFLRSNQEKADKRIGELYAYVEKISKGEGGTTKPSDPVIVSKAIHGFALYGKGKTGEGGVWSWDNRNFEIKGDSPESKPSPGSVAKATSSVIIRSMYPRSQTVEQAVQIPVLTYEMKKIGLIKAKIPVVRSEKKIINVEKLINPPESTIESTVGVGDTVTIQGIKEFGDTIWVELKTTIQVEKHLPNP